jgi:hypothetical protein
MSRHAAVESQRTYPIGVSTNQLHLAVRYLQYDDPPPEKDRVQLPVRILMAEACCSLPQS